MLLLSTGTRNILIGVASCFLTGIVLANAFYQRKQFYPAIVYLTKSNASMAVSLAQDIVVVFVRSID